MSDARLIHVFICPCGQQGRAETGKLHKCPCGISRLYGSSSGAFSESMFRRIDTTTAFYERKGDVFIYKYGEDWLLDYRPKSILVKDLRRKS